MDCRFVGLNLENLLHLQFNGLYQDDVTGNVWGKSCTGGITLKNVLDLSVLHSYLYQIKQNNLFPKGNNWVDVKA